MVAACGNCGVWERQFVGVALCRSRNVRELRHGGVALCVGVVTVTKTVFDYGETVCVSSF
mgnify:CR=1 FL=1